MVTAAFAPEQTVVGVRWPDGARGTTRLTLHFAGAGVASAGATYALGAPAGAIWGQTETSVEVAIPLVALPPFPARGPLTAELCVVPEGTVEAGLHCASLLFPPALKKKAPAVRSPVVALQPRPTGWLGYGDQGGLVWARGDEPLTRDTLERLVAEKALSPRELGLFIPEQLVAPTGQPLVAVVAGANPFSTEGCDDSLQARLMLWALNQKTGLKVLEWPVASCELGRASSVTADDDGGLNVAYNGGAIISFTWATDHYERTELGLRRSPSRGAAPLRASVADDEHEHPWAAHPAFFVRAANGGGGLFLDEQVVSQQLR
jgi:hypothetical protein